MRGRSYIAGQGQVSVRIVDVFVAMDSSDEEVILAASAAALVTACLVEEEEKVCFFFSYQSLHL